MLAATHLHIRKENEERSNRYLLGRSILDKRQSYYIFKRKAGIAPKLLYSRTIPLSGKIYFA